MKTKRLTVLALLAVLFVGCSKEDDSVSDGRIKLFAEEMTHAGSNSKLLVNPGDLSSQWLNGESINVNGNAYTIVKEEDEYYLGGSTATLSAPLYAIYPATTKDTLGNDIVVTNNRTAGCAIDIHSLAVNFSGGGKHEVIFPMAAQYTPDSSGLMFRHLTGGLKLTISNNKASAVIVDSLVVTATRNDNNPAIYKDLKPTWANAQLPGIPGGEVGETTGNVSALFISDMTLKMNTNGSAGVTIPENKSIIFCIPMLAKDLKNLTIKGYNNGVEVFTTPTKTLTSATDVVRNKMYTIPTININ